MANNILTCVFSRTARSTVICGAMVSCGTRFVPWHLSGRPDGAERRVLAEIHKDHGLKRLAALILVIYPAVALYPYRWDPPSVARNTGVLHPQGGLEFAAPGPAIARTAQPPDWVATAKREHGFALDLSVRAASPAQKGPARILTLSQDPWNRNFTIGQEGTDLIVRLRTSRRNPNGLPQFHVPDVFQALRWVDIRVAVEPGLMRVSVDDNPVLQAALSGRPLDSWDPIHKLALGNELTGDRPWLGEVRRAIVEAGNDRIDYAAPGDLRLPERIWFFHVRPRIAPLQIRRSMTF